MDIAVGNSEVLAAGLHHRRYPPIIRGSLGRTNCNSHLRTPVAPAPANRPSVTER